MYYVKSNFSHAVFPLLWKESVNRLNKDSGKSQGSNQSHKTGNKFTGNIRTIVPNSFFQTIYLAINADRWYNGYKNWKRSRKTGISGRDSFPLRNINRACVIAWVAVWEREREKEGKASFCTCLSGTGRGMSAQVWIWVSQAARGRGSEKKEFHGERRERDARRWIAAERKGELRQIGRSESVSEAAKSRGRDSWSATTRWSAGKGKC